MAQFEELTIDKGSDVAIELHLINRDGSVKDLTNYQIDAMLKRSYNSDSDNTLPFTSIVTAPATDGIVVLGLTNLQTDTLKAGRYVYDVELSFADSDGNTIIERVLEGNAQVTPSVTR